VIVAALIAIPGAVVAGLLLKGAIGGDEGSKEFPAIGSAEGSREESSSSPTGSLFTEKGFRAALETVEDKLGSRARILQLRLTDDELQVTGADSERPPQPHLLILKADGETRDQPLQTITGTFFSLEAVRAGAPARIAASVGERRPRGRDPIEYMVLSASPVNGRREWVAFRPGGTQGYRAEANGSDVRLLGQPSRAERAANERRRRQLRRRVRCVRRAAAAGDRAAVQRCLTR